VRRPSPQPRWTTSPPRTPVASRMARAWSSGDAAAAGKAGNANSTPINAMTAGRLMSGLMDGSFRLFGRGGWHGPRSAGASRRLSRAKRLLLLSF